MNRVVYQYYTLKMRKRKGGNLQISSTMVFFPLYFIMDSGYTNEVSVYKLYLLGVNLSVIGRVLGQAFLRTTSPSRLRRATSPGRGGFGSPRKVNGFARGSPTRGAVERSETERLYEGEPFLLASPVSFWRIICYNGFAALPAHFMGREVKPNGVYFYLYPVRRSECSVLLHLQVA